MDGLIGEITNSIPFSIGRRGPSSNKFKGLIDDVRIYQRELSSAEVASLSAAESHAIALVSVDKRSAEQKKTLEQYFQQTQVPELAHLQTSIAETRKAKEDLEKSLPNTMVMSEMDKPRDTFIKVRGNYDLDGAKVVAGVPSFLPQISNTENKN